MAFIIVDHLQLTALSDKLVARDIRLA